MEIKTHAVVRSLCNKEIELVSVEEVKELRFQKKITFTRGKKYHILEWKRNGQDDYLAWTPAEIYAIGSKLDMLRQLDRPEQFRPTKFAENDLTDLSLTNDDLDGSMTSDSDRNSYVSELGNRHSDDEELLTPKKKAQALERKQQQKKKQFNLSMLDEKYAILKDSELSGQASTQVQCASYVENPEPVQTTPSSINHLLDKDQHASAQTSPQSGQQSPTVVDRLALLKQRELDLQEREEYLAKKFEELKKARSSPRRKLFCGNLLSKK